MSTKANNPLIVPMTVEAFVVNDEIRTTDDAFLRTPMLYEDLARMGNAQPGQSDNDISFSQGGSTQRNGKTITNSDYYNGVYLKWRLPKAFTTGAQDSSAGQTTYPIVPNRWLVIRINQATQATTAWIIESDYVHDSSPQASTISEEGSKYVGIASKTTGYQCPTGKEIGKNFPLSGGGTWSESGTSLKLTAIAPGNPAFAFYQPACNNVFSFIDPLTSTKHPDASFTYTVLGWYGLPAEDILAQQPDGFAALIEDLGWNLPDSDSETTATASLLYGFQTDVAWQTKNKPEGGVPAGSKPVSIAVGNTGVEALTALITAQSGDTALDTQLLEAFQLDFMEFFDQPDGAARLEERLERSFFQRFSGGYTWSIVLKPGSKKSTNDNINPAWLLTLNQHQQDLDKELRKLASLQKQLYVLWWKSMGWYESHPPTHPINGLSEKKLGHAINPDTSGSIAAQVQDQLNKVSALQMLVPDGDTPVALQDRVRGSRSSRLPTEPCVRVRTRLLMLYSYPSMKR
ncbi:MAG: hypothetical protein D3910_15325 [Candidatus Electrothrix sp. ATG2]|nr:hypothetical protein [Candidatus Electrothrix sp. ATG2]